MLSEFIIREANLSDAQALFSAHQDAVLNLCAGAYSEAQLATWFEGRTPEIYRPALEAHQILLAEQNGRVLGFVGFEPGEVTLLFVRKEASGQGLGRQLFELGLARAEQGVLRESVFVVATQNAQRFYQGYGFMLVEEDTFVRGKPEVHFGVIKMRRVAVLVS